ncbi:MAG: MOSC domain-containing protein [Chlorobi bacterium]|nr:MOSC domain-containing protein [Chlorobiota bacterium]
MAYIFQINASKGGVPKTGLHKAEVDLNGIIVDDQADKKHHGGPLQGLCLFRLESILELQKEGHPIFPGSTGENITTVGLEPDQLLPGVRLRLGSDIRIELTDFATPCNTIAASFSDGNSNRINNKKHPGWSRVYAKVLTEGKITIGDPIVLEVVQKMDR